MNRFHCTIQKGEINLFTWPQHVLAVILYWRVKIRLAYISCKVFSHNLKFLIIILRLFLGSQYSMIKGSLSHQDVDWPRTKSSKMWFNVLPMNLAIYSFVHHCQTYRKTES